MSILQKLTSLQTCRCFLDCEFWLIGVSLKSNGTLDTRALIASPPTPQVSLISKIVCKLFFHPHQYTWNIGSWRLKKTEDGTQLKIGLGFWIKCHHMGQSSLWLVNNEGHRFSLLSFLERPLILCRVVDPKVSCNWRVIYFIQISVYKLIQCCLVGLFQEHLHPYSAFGLATIFLSSKIT